MLVPLYLTLDPSLHPCLSFTANLHFFREISSTPFCPVLLRCLLSYDVANMDANRRLLDIHRQGKP